MSSKINAISAGVGGLSTSADASGILELQTNDTTAITVDGSQVVSFDNNFGTVAGLPSYQCRAWVNFNGTGTVAIRGSGNVSSITDNGAGDYTINFTSALIDSNFSTSVGGSRFNNGTVSVSFATELYTQTTTSVQLRTGTTTANAAADHTTICASIFR